MSQAVDELWAVAVDRQHVDADALASAVRSAVSSSEPLDYRTRLLIRDSLRALESHWGTERFRAWMKASPQGAEMAEACKPEHFDPDPEEIGFPSLTRRVMEPTKPETVVEFFRVLSRHVLQPTTLTIRGSLALILRGLLSRNTEDADVVNEVPAELRNQHDVLRDLTSRFGLQLTHFQSHYLPTGWERRVESFDTYGQLNVYLIDPYDVMVSKVCSKRDKDLDDLRALKPRIDRDQLQRRLLDSGAKLLSESGIRKAASHHWYVLFGEDLPESS